MANHLRSVARLGTLLVISNSVLAGNYYTVSSAGVGSTSSQQQESRDGAVATQAEATGQLAGLSRAHSAAGMRFEVETFGYATGINQANNASAGFNNSFVVVGNDGRADIPVRLNFRVAGSLIGYSDGITTNGVGIGAEVYTDAPEYREQQDTSAFFYLQGGNGFNGACTACTTFTTNGLGVLFAKVPMNLRANGYISGGLPDPVAPRDVPLQDVLDPYIWDRIRSLPGFQGTPPLRRSVVASQIFTDVSPFAATYPVTRDAAGNSTMAMPHQEADATFESDYAIPAHLMTFGQINMNASVNAYPAPGITFAGATLQGYLKSITFAPGINPAAYPNLSVQFADGTTLPVTASTEESISGDAPLPTWALVILGGVLLLLARQRRPRAASSGG